MIVSVVSVCCMTNIVHLVDGAALHAAGLGLVASEGDPENVVRVGREASASDVLLVTGRVDGNRVLHSTCKPSASHNIRPCICANGLFLPLAILASRTETAGVQWPHVEDIDALHLSEDFQTLQTGGLFGVGRNGTGLRTGGKQVSLARNLYAIILVSN